MISHAEVTLARLEQLYAGDCVNVYEILEAAKVQPLTIDPFNVGRSTYHAATACDAINQYLAEREAAVSAAAVDRARDGVAAAAAEARHVLAGRTRLVDPEPTAWT